MPYFALSLSTFCKRSLFLVFVVAVFFSADAQNLVPNGDFEAYNACPNNISAVDAWPNFPFVQSWVRPTLATPDYFHVCAVGTFVSVPNTLFDYQQPHSGKAFAGFFVHHENSPGNYYREYLSVKLTQPLQKDINYCVSFFVSPAYSRWNVSSGKRAAVSQVVGVNFSDTLFEAKTYGPITLPYDVISDTSIHMIDTARWYQIQGAYRAKGGERWMTIGTFGMQPPPLIYFNAADTGSPFSYYFIDDVSVTPPLLEKNVHDVRVCDTGKVDTILISSRNSGPYKWNTGATSRSIHVNTFGEYYCDVIESCTIHRDSFLLYGTDVPLPFVTDTVICQNSVSPVLTTADSNLVWYTQASAGIGSSMQPAINTSQEGTKKLYVAIFKEGCIGKRVPVNIEVRAAPEEQLKPEALVRCVEDEQAIIKLGTDKGSETHYLWSTGDTTCCITTKAEGLFVRVRSNGCGFAEDSFQIRSERCENCITFPDAFSPNNDGRNDLFRPMMRCSIKDYQLRICNRWGNTVFFSENPSEQWDGSFKGSSAMAGVYMFYATFTSVLTGLKYVVKGDLTLIR